MESGFAYGYYADDLTSLHSKGKFALICVELDLQRDLVPAFMALGREFKLEYEGLHLICFGCGKYSHKKDVCPGNSITPKDGEAVMNSELSNLRLPWRVVLRLRWLWRLFLERIPIMEVLIQWQMFRDKLILRIKSQLRKGEIFSDPGCW